MSDAGSPEISLSRRQFLISASVGAIAAAGVQALRVGESMAATTAGSDICFMNATDLHRVSVKKSCQR